MLQTSILTLNETLYQAPAYSVTLPAVAGELTVLPGHLDLVTPLKAGLVTIRTKPGDEFRATKKDQFKVTGGILEVRGGRELVVLAELLQVVK